MPRFTIKDMLIATTLIAVGAGMLAFLFHNAESTFGQWGLGALPPIYLLWFGGGACIGAGLFFPFKRTRTGVIAAFLIQTFLMALPI